MTGYVAGEYTQYAVEVPGRGYANWASDTLNTEPVYWMSDLDEARDVKYRTCNRFHSLGCSEIAATVRIIAQVVTVACGAPQPVVEQPVTV